MTSKTNRRINIRLFAAVMVIFSTLIFQVFTVRGSAAELLTRSVFIGSSLADEITNHLFTFRSTGPSTVTSMQFEYCVNSPLFTAPCTPPPGLDVSGFTIDAQSGVTGFAPSGSTTASSIVINRTSSIAPTTSSSYDLGNIQNPSIFNETVYVRMSVFDGIDATGTRVDQGAVAFVVDEKFLLQAYVPPYLTFCVGITVSLNCSATNGFIAGFGELNDSNPSTSTSQLSASTNDPDGYNVYVNGQTMTSGNNIITALPSQTSSNSGTSQFGINLRSNSDPFVGANPEVGALGAGTPDTRYNSPNVFRYSDGDRIAGSILPSGFNRYTISYLVNVTNDQAPGNYATTITYTAVATF